MTDFNEFWEDGEYENRLDEGAFASLNDMARPAAIQLVKVYMESAYHAGVSWASDAMVRRLRAEAPIGEEVTS